MHRIYHRLRFGVTFCQIALHWGECWQQPSRWLDTTAAVQPGNLVWTWGASRWITAKKMLDQAISQWWNSQGLRVVSKAAAANWTEPWSCLSAPISTNFPPLHQLCHSCARVQQHSKLWSKTALLTDAMFYNRRALLYTSHKFVRIWLVYDDIETGLNIDTRTFIMYAIVWYSMCVCLYVFYAHVHVQVFSTWSAELSRRQIAGNAFFGAPSTLGGLGQAFFHFQSGPVVGGNPKAERRLWDENEKVIPRDRNKIYTCIICIYTYVYIYIYLHMYIHRKRHERLEVRPSRVESREAQALGRLHFMWQTGQIKHVILHIPLEKGESW